MHADSNPLPSTKATVCGSGLIYLFHGTSVPSVVWALAFLVSGLLGTGYCIHHERLEMEAESRREFNSNCREIQAKIQIRMTEHEQILRGSAAFFADDDGVTRNEWHDFATDQKIHRTLPGIQGIGFAMLVPRSDLEQHLLKIRAEGFPDYHVWPEGERETYSSIVFLEPFSDRNLRAFGYDMLTEPVRRAAMERARDHDEVALSGKVKLVQEDGQDIQAGTLMYMPVYRRGTPHATVTERQTALIGWVYSPYRMRDLITLGMLGSWDLAVPRQIHLQIFDGETAAPTALLYDSHPDRKQVPASAATTPRETVTEHAGRRWLLRFTMLNGADSIVDDSKAWWILGGGTLTSLLLAILTFSLANTRHAARLLAARLTADLRRSDERWKFALEGTGAGLWDWNVPAGTVFFSTRWKEMLGFAEDVIGNSLDEWTRRVHPDDLARTMADVQAHLDGTTPSYANEHRVRCYDGSWKWILVRGLVIEREASGKPLRMIGMHEVISARKQAEIILQESEERFRILFDRANEGIVLLDADGRLIAVNQSFARMHGYGVTEMSQMNLKDLDSPESLQNAPERIARLLAGETLNFEVEHYHKDGHVIPLEVSASLISFGKKTLMQCFHRNITERKQTEEILRQSRSSALNLMMDAVAACDRAERMSTALRASEENYRILFREMQNGFVHSEMICDAQGLPMDSRYLAVNPAFERITGRKAAKVLGKTMREVFPIPEPNWIEVTGRVALTGEPAHFESYTDESGVWLDVSAFRPAPNQYACTFTDITARKQSEVALAEKNAELERFLYTASHDLKSPVVTVQTFLGYLEQDMAAADAGRIEMDLRLIHTATDKMTCMLLGLLEFSRVGRVVSSPVRVMFRELVDDALDAVAGHIAAQGVTVEVGEHAVALLGDRLRLAEIWQNLVENACKFMGGQPAPRIEIGVATRHTETVFFVRDNGIGLDPRHHAKIFNLFEKLDPGVEGTGLGLALIKRIIELYRGRIWVESPGAGLGACFHFTLPAALQHEET